MRRTTQFWFVVLVVVAGALGGCGTAEPSVAVADDALTASCPSLPADVERGIRGRGRVDLDRLYTLDHYVPVGRARWIHLRETFSIRAFLRRHHRAVLMLPGPLVTGEFYQIDVDGYRGRDILASEEAFAFSADFEGSGESSYPEDGRSPSQDSQIDAMEIVLRYIRLIRGVSRVDVMGESWGGGVAAELCADSSRVRSCVLASMLYRTPSDFANMTFRSPGFRGFLDSLPDGYLPTDATIYAGLAAPMEPAVAAAFIASESGLYTTVPLYDVYDLPFFDPTATRVPGLLVQGENDPNQSLDDALDLVADYAGPMDLVVVEGGGHIPRTEPGEVHEQYWAAVLDFLDL
jgi:pimeloyl-ACP methyl ester carboxylesterase